MTARTQPAPLADPFSNRERDTIAEVFAQYDMTPAQNKAAWDSMVRRWHETSGRFRAYAIAHETAAAQESRR